MAWFIIGKGIRQGCILSPCIFTFYAEYIMGFPGGTSGKNPSANAGDIRDADSIPGSGRYPGGGHGNPLQYSCLENPMDRGVCWATVHRVAELDTTEATNTHTRVRTHTHVRTSCEMPGWMNHKLESKLLGDTTLKAESKEELNS